jgi:hypothetical protein
MIANDEPLSQRRNSRRSGGAETNHIHSYG